MSAGAIIGTVFGVLLAAAVAGLVVLYVLGARSRPPYRPTQQARRVSRSPPPSPGPRAQPKPSLLARILRIFNSTAPAVYYTAPAERQTTLDRFVGARTWYAPGVVPPAPVATAKAVDSAPPPADAPGTEVKVEKEAKAVDAAKPTEAKVAASEAGKQAKGVKVKRGDEGKKTREANKQVKQPDMVEKPKADPRALVYPSKPTAAAQAAVGPSIAEALTPAEPPKSTGASTPMPRIPRRSSRITDAMMEEWATRSAMSAELDALLQERESQDQQRVKRIHELAKLTESITGETAPGLAAALADLDAVMKIPLVDVADMGDAKKGAARDKSADVPKPPVASTSRVLPPQAGPSKPAAPGSNVSASDSIARLAETMALLGVGVEQAHEVKGKGKGRAKDLARDKGDGPDKGGKKPDPPKAPPDRAPSSSSAYQPDHCCSDETPPTFRQMADDSWTPPSTLPSLGSTPPSLIRSHTYHGELPSRPPLTHMPSLRHSFGSHSPSPNPPYPPPDLLLYPSRPRRRRASVHFDDVPSVRIISPLAPSPAADPFDRLYPSFPLPAHIPRQSVQNSLAPAPVMPRRQSAPTRVDPAVYSSPFPALPLPTLYRRERANTDERSVAERTLFSEWWANLSSVKA